MVEREELTKYGEGLGTEIVVPRITPDLYIKRPVGNFRRPSVDKLANSARKELKYDFGIDMEVPEPPSELIDTLENFAERGITGFDEVYYQPEKEFKKNDKFWKVKGRRRPEDYFWNKIKNGKYPSAVARLEEGWFIGDRRGKPIYDKGKQRYGEDDYMEPLMSYLRSLGTQAGIEKSDVPDSDYFRFGASPAEIEGKILPTFAKMSGAKGVVRCRKYMEFNVRGNIAHPRWGQTNTGEWFDDTVSLGAQRLFGGFSGYAGLADIGSLSVFNRGRRIGFSPVVFFSTKKHTNLVSLSHGQTTGKLFNNFEFSKKVFYNEV